jgi:ubiquinol-cytochrome c reductase cytochrome b subunit
MKRRLKALNDWVDHRTGLPTAIQTFLYEDIPASAGWHQVFGSVAMFLFMVQAFTGALLAFNYAPTPGDAYNSLRYILTEVTAGRLMRGLHHWGASMMIVVVVLHMVQVFLYGAYKKPRETTWMVGVMLLLLTLAYGLTGYLLPWDNRAYWGTVVTTRIAAQAPLLGSYLTRLLGGDESIGVVTFARFFGLHVLLLPPATALLIGIHVYLVRKHGVAPAPGDETLPTRKFYPQQVLKDTVAIFIAFCILFLMAVAVRVPLEQLADPTDTTYIPRPEWYFLFLFQTLKLFNGPLEVVGSTVLPGLAVLLLLLVPFIDRSAMIKVTRRTFAAAVVLLAAIGWGGLTAAAVLTTPPESRQAAIDYSEPTEWMQLTPEEMAGIGYFRAENCASCHSLTPGVTGIGPDLTQTARLFHASHSTQRFPTEHSGGVFAQSECGQRERAQQRAGFCHSRRAGVPGSRMRGLPRCKRFRYGSRTVAQRPGETPHAKLGGGAFRRPAQALSRQYHARLQASPERLGQSGHLPVFATGAVESAARLPRSA